MTAVGNGTTTITATSGDLYGSTELTVTSAYVLVTQFAGKNVFKIDPVSNLIMSQASFSANVGRPAPDVSRRLAYLTLDDKLIALKTDSMETSLLTVPGLGKDGTFAALGPEGSISVIQNYNGTPSISQQILSDVIVNPLYLVYYQP